MSSNGAWKLQRTSQCKCTSYSTYTSCSDIAHFSNPVYAVVQKLQIMLGSCLSYADKKTNYMCGVNTSLCCGRDRRPSRPPSASRLVPLRFELPSNASLVLGRINTGFDCAELPYGYYADTSNDCALFHVCLPYIDNDLYITRHFSFMCGEGTMFDQERLVCAFPEEALPCSEAAAFRRSNEYFGRADVNFLEK
nr:uncharacterized protein LOC113821611 [Penaeus vannamei]